MEVRRLFYLPVPVNCMGTILAFNMMDSALSVNLMAARH